MVMAQICDIDKVNDKLNTTGKSVFINILYPVLKNNFDADIHDICKLYPEYRIYTDDSKMTRLSSAKSIIRNGWEREALQIISESNKLDCDSVEKAIRYLRQLK